jgi:drug/metabolite transporter (DMT)-like permease
VSVRSRQAPTALDRARRGVRYATPVPAPFSADRSPIRLVVTGAACLVAGIVLANGPRLLPQFHNELIDAAALVAGVLIALAGGLTLAVALLLIVAAGRR